MIVVTVRRIALFVVLAAATALAVPSNAGAVDVSVAAQVLAGTRSITTATVGPLASIGRTATATSAVAVTVTEALVNGDNSWSVTARLCGAAACGSLTDRIVLSGDSNTQLAGSAFELSDVTVLDTSGGLGGGTVTPMSDADLSTTRTLFTNTGQSAASLYSGVYAAAGTLSVTPPANATPGSYTGYLVVTLVE